MSAPDGLTVRVRICSIAAGDGAGGIGEHRASEGGVAEPSGGVDVQKLERWRARGFLPELRCLAGSLGVRQGGVNVHDRCAFVMGRSLHAHNSCKAMEGPCIEALVIG
jgi:hypothetical protein